LGNLRVAKGQKSDIKPKVFKGALNNLVAKGAEATVNSSGVKHSEGFGHTENEIRGGLLLWTHAAPSFKPSHTEDTR
jgi:hypothetical protein